ncbi:GAL4 and fungal transcription factor domain-containing protein [Phanerochaete sordida]|uniref:GAL4 and fungal transcription factor domain-containing protein n=1 Tax=Phanerochaete sordida TaxID=48140 RepID=A0A9P3LDS0_9APHY|nr:GAL4 and fungal transcription factor domain-containing protein [Phanerochaete sordida]
MSPRRSSPDSRSTSPYPPPPPSSKKSKKREQFSACGACRMRRVKCDLKDLPVNSTGQSVSCTNCRERGLKCVDEFAEVKAVKLLRRGRRLQQAEAVYGKVPPDQGSLRSVTPPANVIPRLAPEFFDSSFFWRFQIQRPILEPLEFRERYLGFIKGNPDALQVPGQLIAMTLVVWAASYGMNEYGVEDVQETATEARQRKERINEMLQEILYLVDMHGILRKASWDGVRLLLLLLPLTQELQSPMDRLVMYEATQSQVYNLCSIASTATINSGQGEFIDALVRARVFWYAHILDGVTSGLRGGRLWLSDDDLATFESTLPSRTDNTPGCSIFVFTFRYVAVPLRISSVCRTIHAALTGPKAKQRDGVQEELLTKAWNSLDRCWHDLDGLREIGTAEIIEVDDMERFIHGWQIFIFECHNVIREGLKAKLDSVLSQGSHGPDVEGGLVTSRDGLSHLYDKARTRCINAVQEVVKIIQGNLGSTLFQFDASIIRDGCFFAAFLLAGESGSSSDVEACLQALNEMRWVFSKSEERMHTVQMVWQARVQQGRGAARTQSGSPGAGAGASFSLDDLSYPTGKEPSRSLTIPSLSVTTGLTSRSHPSPNAGIPHDEGWTSTTLSTDSGSLHSQSSTHRSSPSAVRTPPYVGSPHLHGVPRASTSKAPLVASSSVLMPPTSSGMRTMSDPAYYYGAYSGFPLGNAPPHASGSSLAAASAGGMQLHPYSAPAATNYPAGGVPFAASAMAAQDLMPGTSATASEEEDEARFVTDRYYG